MNSYGGYESGFSWTRDWRLCYDEVEKVLPSDYNTLLNRKDTQKVIFALKDYIGENLCKELNLMRVTVPLIVDAESGVND